MKKTLILGLLILGIAISAYAIRVTPGSNASGDSANTPETLVYRDASGNFAAGVITATTITGTSYGEVSASTVAVTGSGDRCLASGTTFYVNCAIGLVKVGGLQGLEISSGTLKITGNVAGINIGDGANGNAQLLRMGAGSGQVANERMTVAGLKIQTVGLPNRGVVVADTTDLAAGVGGGIMFSGVYTGSTQTGLASIEASKENASDGNYAGQLLLKTRANGGDGATGILIDSTQRVGIGVVAPSAKLHMSSGTLQVDGTAANIIFSTFTQTYGSGSAHLCVTNAGLLFSSEAACP